MPDQDPFCGDPQRRADVAKRTDLNGIDYVEVEPGDHTLIHVYFLNGVAVTANAAGISVTGGTRVIGISVTKVIAVAPDGHFDISVDKGGDYSIYAITIAAPELDTHLNRALFSFMASCPVDFDCLPPRECLPESKAEPALDYMAKDYASFRQLMLDLLPKLNPEFVERNPSSLDIALLELLAYTGDQLSYYQDAVANEAFLATARQRISARRHARLVDYRMHDGRNAWTHVHVQVSAVLPNLPQGSPMVTQVSAPLRGDTQPPGAVILQSQLDADALDTDPALSGAVVFETTHPIDLYPVNNEILIHTWGNLECCLATGTTDAFLYSVSPGGSTAIRPVLAKGDFVLFEEVLGPATGDSADASPRHRQVVQISEDPQATTDPVYNDQITNGTPGLFQPGDTELPLVHIRWRRQDPLAFPVCVSVRHPDTGLISNVSIARGNMVLADHGLTTGDDFVLTTPVPAGDRPFQLGLARSPLTVQCVPTDVTTDMVVYDPITGRLITPRRDVSCDVREAQPSVTVFLKDEAGNETLWLPRPDLLESSSFDQHFVAEVGNDGNAVLRFGDGEYGTDVGGTVQFRPVYRIGNGRAGNVGNDALAHVVLAAKSAAIVAIRNPIPATGGTDPETIEEVRQFAPQTFRAEQFRAVTEADYRAAARKLPEVSSAAASFRWTGSWYTVYVGIQPRDSSDLILQNTGEIDLSPLLKLTVSSALEHYRLAGYDLEIRPPTFVPIELWLEVCAAAGYFREDVARAVVQALGTGVLPDGRPAFFNQQRFAFNQSVYLSQIYAAVMAVQGVSSLQVTRLRRFQQLDTGELAKGVLPIGPWEIAQLDNDPNFMEHGVLQVTGLGGKA